MPARDKSLLLPKTRKFLKMPVPRNIRTSDDITQFMKVLLVNSRQRKDLKKRFIELRDDYKDAVKGLDDVQFIANTDLRALRNIVSRLNLLYEDADNIVWSIQNLSKSDEPDIVAVVTRKIVEFIKSFEDADVESSYNQIVKKWGELLVKQKNIHHNPSRKNLKLLGDEIDQEQKAELKRLKNDFLTKRSAGALVVNNMPVWAYVYGRVNPKDLEIKGFETYKLYHDGRPTINLVHANHIILIPDLKRFGNIEEQLAYVNDLNNLDLVFVTDQPSSDAYKAYWVMDRRVLKRFKSVIRSVGDWVLMFLG